MSHHAVDGRSNPGARSDPAHRSCNFRVADDLKVDGDKISVGE
jgi:hypothetical protein